MVLWPNTSLTFCLSPRFQGLSSSNEKHKERQPPKSLNSMVVLLVSSRIHVHVKNTVVATRAAVAMTEEVMFTIHHM